MTGYKGKATLDAGSYYAPYVPLMNSPKETWETFLVVLSMGINLAYDNDPTKREEQIVRTAQERMQMKYPGPYIVEPYYNAKKGKFDLRLKFEDSKEELMWKIKWT